MAQTLEVERRVDAHLLAGGPAVRLGPPEFPRVQLGLEGLVALAAAEAEDLARPGPHTAARSAAAPRGRRCTESAPVRGERNIAAHLCVVANERDAAARVRRRRAHVARLDPHRRLWLRES
eukprot:5135218-Prymnesium_polylepis.2